MRRQESLTKAYRVRAFRDVEESPLFTKPVYPETLHLRLGRSSR